MATPSHAQAVKSLNKSAGRRRFIFKTFSQRIEGIEIDVYRSLDKIKDEPSEGSSFFRDFLVEWRELNTAEDFISFYEEMLPLVQTLPLVLLHKELIVSELLSRLQMKARLSLEPILRLIAVLSRDLLEDYISFLPRIADSLASILKSGADREPDIIEQIFTSWSCILMYLQKYLVKDVVHVLKLTVNLRYYPKDYVREFMAEATSFLLRNAPEEQLRKGIRKIMFEVVKQPLLTRKSGVSSLLYHIMKGTSSRFHSRADRVLQLLIKNSTLTIGEKFDQDGDSVLEVLTATFQRLCEDLEPKEFNLIWDCLDHNIDDSENCQHISCLLSLLISTVEVNNGMKISDYQPVIKRVRSILQKFIVPSSTMVEASISEVIDKVLQLMLRIIDGLKSSNDISAISDCSLQWTPVFQLRNSSCLSFIRELLEKDPCIIYAFRVNMLSALNDLIEVSQEEVLCMLLSFCERVQKDPLSSGFLDGTPDESLSNISCFIQGTICSWTGVINNIVLGSPSSTTIDKDKLSLLWGVVCCYPHVMGTGAQPSLLMDSIDALNRLLTIDDESIAGVPRCTWQSLVGAALNSYCKVGKISGLEETSKILCLAKKCKSSLNVLSAVADYLDYVHGPKVESNDCHKTYHPEFGTKKAVDALEMFVDNLCNSDKGIRVSTLRILCHYEYQECELLAKDERPEKRMKTEVPQGHSADCNGFNVLQLLLMIEATPLSISTSRKVILLISKIQMALSAGRISESYIPVILSGMIGIFHNRFSYLWNPASECLAFLIGENVSLVWDKFVHYFENCLSTFQSLLQKQDGESADFSCKSSGLVDRFTCFAVPAPDSTPLATILTSLLQCLQKISSVAESHSRNLVPLFLKFLGYNNDDLLSVGLFCSNACKGKEWRGVLKEWLNLFKLMRNPKAFYRGQFLKDVLLIRLMDDNDAEIQMRVLDCLLTWKDGFLIPYEQHLRNLITSKQLREELTTWSLSRESYLIEEGHRANLVPLIILILMPKVRKLKTLASRKHTSVHHRKAVLQFIAQLDVNEIPLFFASLIKPLGVVGPEADGITNMFWTLPKSSGNEIQAVDFLKYFTLENMAALSWKKRYGFLHVIEDILGVFDESHIIPFLDLLIGCVVRVMGSCTSSLDAAKGSGSWTTETNCSGNLELHKEESAAINLAATSTSLKQFKDLRSLCLKIVSVVLNKYEDHDFGCEFWDMLFKFVKPLIDSFKQEGSSSEKPSSLFSCFLAMSSSSHLLPLLSRERNLVPDIFSILTVPTASEAIKSCVLKFVENLLNLDEELADEDNVAKKLILPNIDKLITSFHCLFLGDHAGTRKLVKYPGEAYIRIFKLLVKYLQYQIESTKFLDVLLHLLAKSQNDSGVCVECLQIIRAVIPVLGNENSKCVLNAISPLLISVDLDVRLKICDLLDALAKVDPSLLSVAKLIQELNATSATEIGGLDYDSILSAYEKINVDLFYSIEGDQVLAVLSHCVHDMSSEELILRHSAYRSLLSFVEFCASILGGDDEGHDSTCQGNTTGSNYYWTKSRVRCIVNKFILKHMENTMKNGGTVRKEWIELLRGMVLKLPKEEKLTSLKALWSDNVEQDFFNNIIHLQRPRRKKAIKRFNSIIGNKDFPFQEDIMNRIFVPLFFNMLFDVQGGKGKDIRTACINGIASIAARMEWKSYYAILSRCFKEVKMNQDKQKILLPLICSILDKFHFSQNFSNQDKNSLDSILGADTTETGPLATLHKCGHNSSAMLVECSTSVIASDVQACLRKTVLPKLQKLLDVDADKVNVNIIVALLRVLKLLPVDMMDSQLPSIIHRIANHLKSRTESVRDQARRALAECLKELGLEYLQFVVGVLKATLKRGFELHVLGYTLNFILSKLLSHPSNDGKLDYCVEDLLSVVENDILGDVAEEKEVGKIAAKMKETRKVKSFETLEIIAQNITFKSHGLKLLSPVEAHLHKHLTSKLKTKLESMLKHIADGIKCNPSVDQTDLFHYIYVYIQNGVNAEHGQGANATGFESTSLCRHGNEKAVSGTKSGCSHLFTGFALGLLNERMKSIKSLGLLNNRKESIKLEGSKEELLSMLDPFVKLLGDCLSSRYEDILAASLRCLTELVRLPLPSLASQADKIKETLLGLAQSFVSANNSLMESCLKMITVLLGSTKITLSSEELHLLIQFPLFVDLERNPSSTALSVLKAVVNRKLVVPEIYDLMIRIGELMVTSQVDSIRKECSKILLQFLLDYHLSGTYLQQQLDFLLRNLSYGYSTGREALLEMLRAIIGKFPRNFLDKDGQTIFIHLVQSLVNDSDQKVRLMTGTVLKLLIGRASPHFLDTMLEFSLSWYVDKKRQLQSIGAQVMGLLVEVLTENFEKHISSILPVSKSILQAAADVVADSPSRDLSDDSIPLWKEAYYSLVLLEKILHRFHDLSFENHLEDIWEAICKLLLHPHPWVRKISSRLVAFYFEASKKGHGTFYLMKPHRLFMIAISLCCQLKTQAIDNADNSIMKNIVFTICNIHSLMGSAEYADPVIFWSALEQHEQCLFLKALQLLDSRKAKSTFLNVISGAHDQEDGHQSQNLQYLLISTLIKEMGKIALQTDEIQMKVIFTSFEKISSEINQDELLQHYAFDILLPLYKVREGLAGKVISDDLKQQAEDVYKSVKDALGAQNCDQVCNKIRESMKGRRDKRKQEEKVMAVVNPMRNAKRKLRLAEKHRVHKKRKLMTMKMSRWMR